MGIRDAAATRDDLERLVRKTIIHARLMMGAGFVERLLLLSYCNAAEGTSTANCRSWVHLDTINDGVPDQGIPAEHLSNANIADLSDETCVFLDLFFSHEEPWQKLLFGWIALESILGDGREREAFFLRTLRRPELNDAAKSIFLLRNNIKHGESVNVPLESVYLLNRLIRCTTISCSRAQRQYAQETADYIAARQAFER